MPDENASTSREQLELPLGAAKSGSDSALGRALETCRPRLLYVARRVVARRLQPRVGASDLVQDTFVNATKSFRAFKGKQASDFLSWLRKILFNRLAEISRQGGRYGASALQVSLQSADDPAKRRSLNEELSPSKIAAKEEVGQLIQAAVMRLPERHQKVLRMRYNDCLSFLQIGQQLGLTEDGSRMLFMRAVKRLKRELPGYREK
jgi:RNA polymerase sigma-70 factor, ECF subfamily